MPNLQPDTVLINHDQVVSYRENLVGENETRCPTCDNSYKTIGLHWSKSDCSWPSYTFRQWEILTGLLMGDGWIDVSAGGLKLDCINRRYMDHVRSQFPMMMRDVTLRRTAREAAEEMQRLRDEGVFSPGNHDILEENYHDKYEVATKGHPDNQYLQNWYRTGEKVFPSDLILTPTILKHWYCGDGSISGRSMSISSKNERARSDQLEAYFEQYGLSPTYRNGSVCFNVSDTEELLDWMGTSPPGFEYKWETGERYRYLKDLAYGDI